MAKRTVIVRDGLRYKKRTQVRSRGGHVPRFSRIVAEAGGIKTAHRHVRRIKGLEYREPVPHEVCYINEQFDTDLSDWIITESTPGIFTYGIVSGQLHITGNVSAAASYSVIFEHIEQDAPVDYVLRFSTSGTATGGGSNQSYAWIKVIYFDPDTGHDITLGFFFLQDKTYTFTPPYYWIGAGAKIIVLRDYIPANAESIRTGIKFYLANTATIDANVEYLSICET